MVNQNLTSPLLVLYPSKIPSLPFSKHVPFYKWNKLDLMIHTHNRQSFTLNTLIYFRQTHRMVVAAATGVAFVVVVDEVGVAALIPLHTLNNILATITNSWSLARPYTANEPHPCSAASATSQHGHHLLRSLPPMLTLHIQCLLKLITYLTGFH